MNAADPLHVTATAVLAGIPVHVYAVAVVVIVDEAIVHVPAAVVAVPVAPSLNVPLTAIFPGNDEFPFASLMVAVFLPAQPLVQLSGELLISRPLSALR